MANAYLDAAKARKKNQTDIKDKLSEKRIIEKINISIPSDYKDKLLKYCDNNYISASAFLRQCIDEKCNDTH